MKYLSVVKDFNFLAPGVPFCQCQCFEMQLFNVWVVQDSDLTTTHPTSLLLRCNSRKRAEALALDQRT